MIRIARGRDDFAYYYQLYKNDEFVGEIQRPYKSKKYYIEKTIDNMYGSEQYYYEGYNSLIEACRILLEREREE